MIADAKNQRPARNCSRRMARSFAAVMAMLCGECWTRAAVVRRDPLLSSSTRGTRDMLHGLSLYSGNVILGVEGVAF